MSSQRPRTRPRTVHEQLELLDRIHAGEVAETASPQHATVRRLARFFDDLFPELGRSRCWFAACQLADSDASASIWSSYLEALRDVAVAALDRQAQTAGAA